MDDVPQAQDPNPSSMNDDYKPAAAANNNDGSDAPLDSSVGGIPGGEGVASASSAAAGDGAMEDGALPSGGGGGDTGGNLYLRPVFFGNLSHGATAADVDAIFSNPPSSMGDGEVKMPYPVDRVDMKRGYAFVFLKDPPSLSEKERTEHYVGEINGMNIANVSNALRAEFARGDGRVKRKEDERRKKIQPNETLFVVNFHEETTKREDLQMLFEPYGELVRIDMKRNYAFVQFKTIDEAIRAKDATNGGKLDQSEITVEFVARRMGEGGGERRGGGRRYEERGGYRAGGRGGRDEYRPRRDEYRPRGGGGYRGDRYDDEYRRGGGGGYRDDRRRGGRSRSRSRSPGYRRRSRSRSPGYDREYRSSRDEYRPSSRGGRDTYEDREPGREPGREPARERVERGYGRSEY